MAVGIPISMKLKIYQTAPARAKIPAIPLSTLADFLE